VRAPKVMGKILDDEGASPRHRIEASRELRATAIGSGDAERPTDSERFIIRIDLTAGGGEVHQFDFDKPTKMSADDSGTPEQPKRPTPKRAVLTMERGVENKGGPGLFWEANRGAEKRAAKKPRRITAGPTANNPASPSQIPSEREATGVAR